MAAPSGIGRIERTLDEREKDLCAQLASRITGSIRDRISTLGSESLRVISHSLEERSVAAHLKHRFKIEFDISEILILLRELAEQSYENKALTFGLIITGDQSQDIDHEWNLFPRDFIEYKRYRALSDGFKTAYRISKTGKLIDLVALDENGVRSGQGSGFFPEWGKGIANCIRTGELGLCLTRQGDLLVFDSGNLRFTYRSGRWQYWNHQHVVDLLRNRMRVQHVSRDLIPKVARSIYRAALDVSFRRSGALFIVLRRQSDLRQIVLDGDAIGDDDRPTQHQCFDRCVEQNAVFIMHRALLSEIAGLDGAVVTNNKGRILAYACVLRTDGDFEASEGSRTKAAIHASKFGLAIKVSSDGDISFYESQKKFLAV